MAASYSVVAGHRPLSPGSGIAQHIGRRLNRRLHLADGLPGLIRAAEARTAWQAAAQIATNLIAPILLAQAALLSLEASGGVIINVSTSVGQRAWPGSSVYAAPKTALETLTRRWAVELAPRGTRVAAVAPGAIDTPIEEPAPPYPGGHTQ